MKEKNFQWIGERSSQWRGDNVGYRALHTWVVSRLVKPERCSKCGKEAKALDCANISGEYKRDLSDWEYLCRRCHMFGDRRIENIRAENVLKRGVDGIHEEKPCRICGSPTATKFCSEACFKISRKLYDKNRKRPKIKTSV